MLTRYDMASGLWAVSRGDADPVRPWLRQHLRVLDFTCVKLRKAKKWGLRQGALALRESALAVQRKLVGPTDVRPYLQMATRQFEPGDHGPLDDDLTKWDRAL
ncbi:hypothetical protein F6B41_33050 [Microbacterium lushaniae]|nr:hypothetical protein F6B41_33050 [Microbacterium lushaniae]